MRDENDALDVERVCVDLISLLVNIQNTPHQFLAEPLCHTYDENVWFGDYAYDMGDGISFNLTNHWYYEFPYQDMVPFKTDHPDVVEMNFWFPYDGFIPDMNMQAQTTITLSDGSTKTEVIPIYYERKLQSSSSRPWDITM